MAKERTYIVSFNQANRTDRGFYTVHFDISKGNTDHKVTCYTFDQLERQVRLLAADYGLPCSAYIRLPKSERNPPGFEKFCKTLNIIDVEPVLA